MDLAGNLTGIISIFRYSTRKILLSRKAVLTILVALFVGGIMGYAGAQEVDRLSGGANLMDLLVLSFFMPIVAMIYGASIIRDEIEDRSITQVLMSPVDRAAAYMGYYFSLVLSLSIVMVLIMTVAFLAFFGQTGIDGDALGIYSSMCGLGVIGAAVYSSLFLFMSVLLNRPMYLGLLYAFIWEGFIGSLGGRIGEIAIKHYIRSIGSGWIAHGDISGYAASGEGYSAQVIAGVTIAFLILGILVLRDKEFP